MEYLKRFITIASAVSVFCLVIISAAQFSYSFNQEKTIVVMPFVKGGNPDTDTPVIDTVITNFEETENYLSGDADIILTRILHKLLVKMNFRVIDMELVLPAYEELASDEDHTQLISAVKLGKAFNADYVVTGNVWRFRERSGNAIATEQPASVGFKIHLISVAAQARIWKAVVDETQQPLSENLFRAIDFLTQGSQWLSAEDLAIRELDAVLKRFPVEHDNY